MIKNLQGQCAHCGGILEFRADAVGTSAPCPHCGRTTELRLFTPPAGPAVARRTLFYLAAAALILGMGCAATLLLLRRAETLSRQQDRPAPPAGWWDAPNRSPR